MDDATKRTASGRPDDGRPQGKRMRPTLVTLVNGYTFIDKNIAFTLLKQVEVRDAMTFAIAAAKHPKWINIRRIMDEDRIWLEWLKRDMPAIFGDGTRPRNYRENIENRMETAAENNKLDTPVAKTIYLWCRLAVSIWQFEIVDMYNRFVEDDRENKIFMGTPSFQYLNVVSFSDGDMMDFGDFFVSMLESDLYLGIVSTDQVLKWLKENRFKLYQNVGLFGFQTNFFKEKYPTMLPKKAKEYVQVQYNILKKYLKTGAGTFLPTTYPRLVEETRLIVASPICAQCQQEATHMCAQCRTPYCSQECQVKDWFGGHRGVCE